MYPVALQMVYGIAQMAHEAGKEKAAPFGQSAAPLFWEVCVGVVSIQTGFAVPLLPAAAGSLPAYSG